MLQCIISALKAEAEPLAKFFGLKQDTSYNYPLYDGDDTRLEALWKSENSLVEFTAPEKFKEFSKYQMQKLLFFLHRIFHYL